MLFIDLKFGTLEHRFAPTLPNIIGRQELDTLREAFAMQYHQLYVRPKRDVVAGKSLLRTRTRGMTCLETSGACESHDNHIACPFQRGLSMRITHPGIEEAIQQIGAIVQIRRFRNKFRGSCREAGCKYFYGLALRIKTLAKKNCTSSGVARECC